MDSVLQNPNEITNHSSIDLVSVFLNELTGPPYDIILSAQFSNERLVYEWNGLTLEVDETTYTFGTAYELEGLSIL